MAFEALLAALSSGAIIATIGPAIVAVAQPFLIIASISLVCAVLSGYKRLWWLRWIGFIVNLAAGLFFLVGACGGDKGSFLLALPAAFYLLTALLFYLVARKDDAERLRRPAALLQAALCVVGLGSSLLASRYTGMTTLALTSIFYIVLFALHYRVIKSIKLGVKPLAKTVGVLVLSLAGVLVFLFIRPVMVGPLLLSWLSILVFAETLLLSSRQPDVAYVGWRQNIRKTAKLFTILAVLAGVIAGGTSLYNWRVTSGLPSVESLKSTEGLRELPWLSEEQASGIVLIPLEELPPLLFKATKSFHHGNARNELLRLILALTDNDSSGTAERKLLGEMEGHLSDTQALSIYLAIADYGREAYGLSAAAKVYYNKKLDELDLCEASLLFCLAFAHLNDLDNAKYKQGYLLENMVRAGDITDDERQMCIKDE